ncbi:MAG: lipoate--protein ligase [Prolixibacteraceae bacterium]|nr:lipoate--protein ligase [Prolixibacteraceae bacterium]
MMKLLSSNTTNPYINLATEEYLLKETDESYLFIYINDVSVIIGKNQNVYTEVSTEYIKNNQIPVIRRISGGGTVVHDKGNLNFSIILQQNKNRLVTLPEIIRPIQQFLEDCFNIEVELTTRNSLLVNNKKVSGSAFCYHKDRLLAHGTLLINSDLDRISKILHPNPYLFKGRRVKSIISRMINLSRFKSIPRNTKEVEEIMIEYFTRQGYIKSSLPRHTNTLYINKLIDQKYSSWEWNIAHGPDFVFHPEGTASDMFHVKKGRIQQLQKEDNEFVKFKLSEIEDSLLIGKDNNLIKQLERILL